MSKLLFIPFSVIGGILAGVVGKQAKKKSKSAPLVEGGAMLTLKRSSANGSHSEAGEDPARQTPEPESAVKAPAK